MHRDVDATEDAQSRDIRNAANGDRIREVLDLAFGVSKRRLWTKARTFGSPGSHEVDPVARHLLSQLPIGRSPVPRRLVQMVEDIPEPGEVARACVSNKT
jgi:hypothetical protein